MNIETGRRLCEYRKKNKYSQEELAEKIGVSRQAVSKWERAEASPDTDNLIMLAKIYGVTLDELINSDPFDSDEGSGEPLNDSVSFKNGIHIHSKDGERVDIGFGGIHVDSPSDDTHVHIDGSGVFIKDGDKTYEKTPDGGHIFSSRGEDNCPKAVRGLKKFPYPVVCALLYIIFGFCDICGGWDVGWIVFMTVPLYYTLIDAICKKNAAHFAYPVLAAMIYIVCGLVYSNWHPSWIIFLTVPIYYFVCDIFKHK